jgi:ribA/ribD-fused uncharacterized protein
MNSNSFTFFWKTGPFTQRFMSEFIVDGVIFNCAEQYMMAEKARMFGDIQILNQIMSTNNPMEQKRLGRLVRNFDPVRWGNKCNSIVYKGNINKFEQNPRLKQRLLDTKDSIMVEASPYDKIWGVGLRESDPRITNPDLWQGQNRLGFVLMQVRDKLKSETPSYNQLFISKSCPICLEDFDLDNDSLSNMDCGHVYHTKCKERLNKCAICRK